MSLRLDRARQEDLSRDAPTIGSSAPIRSDTTYSPKPRKTMRGAIGIGRHRMTESHISEWRRPSVPATAQPAATAS